MNLKMRMQGSLWGQIIGDAIALGTHWIYDPDKMKKEFPKIEGFEKPKSGHYHYGKESGDSTHYGYGFRLMLKSIVEKKNFDLLDFSKQFRSFFGSTSYQGYLDHATKKTLENMKNNQTPTGADDFEMATATRLAPLVVFYYNSPEFEKKVVEATEMSQNNPIAGAYMKCNAQILKDLLQGNDLQKTFKKRLNDPIVGKSIHDALNLKNVSPYQAVKKFGLTCSLKEAFPSAVYLALIFNGSFEKALLENTKIGGDSAGRGGMLGSWLGAYQGFEKIPPHWVSKILDKEIIASLIDQLINFGSSNFSE